MLRLEEKKWHRDKAREEGAVQVIKALNIELKTTLRKYKFLHNLIKFQCDQDLRFTTISFIPY